MDVSALPVAHRRLQRLQRHLHGLAAQACAWAAACGLAAAGTAAFAVDAGHRAGQPAEQRTTQRTGQHPGQHAASDTTAQAATGVVTHVTDGDTLWVRLDAADAPRPKPIKLRLQGIDAPERCQAWGAQSQAALAAKVLQRRVQVETRARDDYDRTLGNLLLDGEDISAWLVLEGHAWSYRYRRSPGPYAEQEQSARKARKGLFADPQAMEPREFRKTHGPCH